MAENISNRKCDCARSFQVKLARQEDYKPFKHLLDIGRHPSFIGRDSFGANSINGGALFFSCGGEIVAVSLINPHHGILLAMNVAPKHRGHGLGSAILNFLMPNFARVIESKVEWFAKRGYKPIGALRKGIRLNTQVMARAALFELAGKISAAFNNE